jgi:rhodanese-related sulfurtransferase
MKSVLTEAELRLLLICNEKNKKAIRSTQNEMFAIGKVPLSSTIKYPSLDFIENLSIPICQNIFNELGFEVLATELISAQDLNKNNSILIDLRTKEEFIAGNIPSSVNVNINFLTELNTHHFRSQKQIIIYCSDGTTSLKALLLLKFMGFTNVKILLGGYSQWMISGE